MPSSRSQAELFGIPGKSVHIQHCQRGLAWPHQQTPNEPGPCCATTHRHGVMGGISTSFIYIGNTLLEIRTAASLSLAGKTLVPFSVFFHELLSSKQPMCWAEQSARRTVCFIFLPYLAHTVRHRAMRRARAKPRILFRVPEQRQTLGWLLF